MKPYLEDKCDLVNDSEEFEEFDSILIQDSEKTKSKMKKYLQDLSAGHP